MNKEKAGASKGSATDDPGIPNFPGVVTENFGTFEVDEQFEPGQQCPTPNGMYFRAKAGAGPDYPPKAHITTVGERKALAIQLGALAPEGPPPPFPNVKGNTITFDFPMGRTRRINRAFISLNAGFKGVRVSVVLTQFALDEENAPDLPGFSLRNFNTIKGDMVYDTEFLSDRGRVTLVSIEMAVDTHYGTSTELPVTIKEVAWNYADGQTS